MAVLLDEEEALKESAVAGLGSSYNLRKPVGY